MLIAIVLLLQPLTKRSDPFPIMALRIFWAKRAEEVILEIPSPLLASAVAWQCGEQGTWPNCDSTHVDEIEFRLKFTGRFNEFQAVPKITKTL